ncbi:glycoside hydrolase family 57 protein [Halothermothrix orenii]|uniref:Uncharacterized conserved protein n=1 Tax=Halothermothrix orenii (strain H 168 / OCM 544 / DSM 9562) TaxID=373903 RepID=B8CYI0_HALOH|nr:1,4-alpha-glucan branching protein domain-containing protein [Halothermothrix orenii]ACL70349.1 uncharacterized conserved protein [Halothermothrix orenii H 168]
MSKGFLALILHAHLPFVRHTDGEGKLAEDWLYEAITETYIPLLNIMERLHKKGVNFRLTLNISPSLASMLDDELLQKRYLNHLENLIELSEKEIERNSNTPRVKKLAEMYNYLFKEARYVFHEKYKNNILKGFKKFQELNRLEIITSAATHGYLPLILTEKAVNAQVATGINTYERIFGQKPKGFWLPECAFKPGIDAILADKGIRYFISSTHGILYATPRPRYGVYSPVYTPNGVAAFGRDVETSKQVWSANEGYPGDFDYREFYRDIGFDLDYDYIKKYLPDGIRKHVGIKYHRITGKSDYKELYDPDRAREKAAEHAANFIFNRQHQIKYLSQVMDRKPVVVAPYDAELFGHWWFEGPQWLEFLLEKIHYDQEDFTTITPSEYLDLYPRNQVAMPAESSWGYKGYHEVWLNGSNDWVYRHLHEAELKMITLADKYNHLEDKDNIFYRALNQMARELLLAQSSDWAFIIKTNTMVEYAIMRTKKHLFNFRKLSNQVEGKNLDKDFLSNLEKSNNIFPEIDFKIYNQNINKGWDLKEGISG